MFENKIISCSILKYLSKLKTKNVIKDIITYTGTYQHAWIKLHLYHGSLRSKNVNPFFS